MANDSREGRHDLLAAWGPTADVQEGLFGDAAWWLAGGTTLLAWTAFVLVLTAT